MGAPGAGGNAWGKGRMAQFQDVIRNYACNHYLALEDFVKAWTYGLPRYSVVFQRHILSG